MTRKREKIDDYTRVSKAQEESGWLAPIAKALGLGMYARDRKHPPWIMSRNDKKVSIDNDHLSGEEPFWFGVTIGHWVVGPVGRVRGVPQHVCMSRCGVVALYQSYEIAAGKLAQTCYGCRKNEHEPPQIRTLPEEDVERLQQFWEDGIMATAFEEKSNLKGREAIDAWDNAGRYLLSDLCEQTGYGRHFGWKLFVRDCHQRSEKKRPSPRIRVRAVYKAEKRVELVCQAADSHYEFDVDLATGRTDVDFMVVAQRIQEAVEFMDHKPDTKPTVPAKSVAAAATAIEANGHPKIIDLEKLGKLAKGLETAMRIGKDVNELAGMKMAAQEKLRVAAEQSNAARVELVKAESEMAEAKAKFAAHEDRVRDAEIRLKNEMALRDEAGKNYNTKTVARDHVFKTHQPLSESVAVAEKELHEIERMESEQLKAIGDAKGLEALLSALSKIPG